ncbi:MAG TPA: hypothetical protein VFP72_11080, partial [Kineosporiaceae bacterium]|nr:hypothetical protein [Kineosporiaceae bacterium]
MNDVTTDVGLVEGRPSCQGCGTTVLAAVTVHPSQGAYLVEDQVRGLQQWLTAWCDACAETELGDEPGWLMPEDADAATWPSLAADTITGRRWPAVGVCFARHNYIGGDGGEGEGSGSGWWRDLRVVAMARRLSCGSWPWAGTTVDPRDRSQWSAAASLGD